MSTDITTNANMQRKKWSSTDCTFLVPKIHKSDDCSEEIKTFYMQETTTVLGKNAETSHSQHYQNYGLQLKHIAVSVVLERLNENNEFWKYCWEYLGQQKEQLI